MNPLPKEVKHRTIPVTLSPHDREDERGPAPSVPLVPLKRSLMDTPPELGTTSDVKGSAKVLEALPVDRGPHEIPENGPGNSTGPGECLPTQKAAMTHISQFTQTAQPLFAHTTAVTQTAQISPQIAQRSQAPQPAVNGSSPQRRAIGPVLHEQS